MTSLLGPSGSPYVELGGERAWRQRIKGDIVVSYQWLDLQAHDPSFPDDGPVPCMVLFAANRRIEAGAYTIPQRNAHAYAQPNGEPTIALIGAAMKACMTLGFDMNEKLTRYRMVDAIVEGIPDLILMPSDQPGALDIKRATQGIETIVRAGGRVLHEELR